MRICQEGLPKSCWPGHRSSKRFPPQVTVFAAGFGLIAAIAGIFGMNLAPLPVENTEVSIRAYQVTFLRQLLHTGTLLLVILLNERICMGVLLCATGSLCRGHSKQLHSRSAGHYWGSGLGQVPACAW